jgi:hypothetical protein
MLGEWHFSDLPTLGLRCQVDPEGDDVEILERRSRRKMCIKDDFVQYCSGQSIDVSSGGHLTTWL